MKEEHGLLGFDLGDRPHFYPFRKLVDGYKQVGIAPGHLLEGPDQIKPPDHEWPRDGDGLESLGWQMGLSCVVLTPFAFEYNTRAICHRGWLVEAMSKSIPDEGPRRSMVAAGTMVDVF
jgi:hypothetical protein